MLGHEEGDSENSHAEDPEIDGIDYLERWQKLVHDTQAFSKVHLTACVLVGLWFICTASSFFILPTLEHRISVGSLALAKLSSIFLLTSRSPPSPQINIPRLLEHNNNAYMPSSTDRIVYILRAHFLLARPECRKLSVRYRAATPKKYKKISI